MFKRYYEVTDQFVYVIRVVNGREDAGQHQV